MNFKIVGNRPYIRLDEEMALVNKKAADDAFKKYKKEMIDSCLKERGFLKYKSNSYVRKSKIDLLEYIDFQKEHCGSKTFTVNLAVMPLYIPHESIAFGFSKRLGELICNHDIWWDFADEIICEKSMDNVKDAIGSFAVPWFHKMENEHYITMQLIKQRLSSKMSNHNQEWLHTISNRSNQVACIQENMDKLKLPKNLIRQV